MHRGKLRGFMHRRGDLLLNAYETVNLNQFKKAQLSTPFNSCPINSLKNYTRISLFWRQIEILNIITLTFPGISYITRLHQNLNKNYSKISLTKFCSHLWKLKCIPRVVFTLQHFSTKGRGWCTKVRYCRWDKYCFNCSF